MACRSQWRAPPTQSGWQVAAWALRRRSTSRGPAPTRTRKVPLAVARVQWRVACQRAPPRAARSRGRPGGRRPGADPHPPRPGGPPADRRRQQLLLATRLKETSERLSFRTSHPASVIIASCHGFAIEVAEVAAEGLHLPRLPGCQVVQGRADRPVSGTGTVTLLRCLDKACTRGWLPSKRRGNDRGGDGQ